MDKADEQDLVRRAVADEDGAFDELCRVSRPSVFKFLMNKTGYNEALSNDLAQDVFIKVQKSLSTFRAESQLNTWLYTIATRTFLNHLKKKEAKHEETGLLNDTDDYFLGADQSALDVCIQDEAEAEERAQEESLNAVFEKAFETPEDSKSLRIIFLYEAVYNNMEYQEIAEKYDVALGTAKSRVHRAKSELRAELNF